MELRVLRESRRALERGGRCNPRSGRWERVWWDRLVSVVLGALCLAATPAGALNLPGLADSEPAKHITAGNVAYAEGKYEEAAQEYAKAQELSPQSAEAAFNAGVALFRLGKWDEALQRFLQAGRAGAANLASGARFNAGNTLLSLKRPREAAELYKQVLREQPDHAGAKRNLEIALRQLQEQEQQEQKRQCDSGEKSSQEQKGAKEQEEKPSAGSGAGATPTPQEQESRAAEADRASATPTVGAGSRAEPAPTPIGKAGEPQPTEAQAEKEAGEDSTQPGQISPEQIEALLEALRDREAQIVQEAMRRRIRTRVKVEKDW